MPATMKAIHSADGTVQHLVTITPEEFKAKVQEYIDISPVSEEWNKVFTLQFPADLQPPKLFTTFKDILTVVKYVCAAVEVAKTNLLNEQDPDRSKGAKFDNAVALGAAADIVFSLVQFNGPKWLPGFMTLLHKFWKPLLNIVISVFVSQQPVGWAAIAAALLKVALV